MTLLKRIRHSNQSILLTWLISYGSILIIPIVISGIIYASTLQIVKTEINRANELALQQMKQSIDSMLRGVERLSVELSMNKSVVAFSYESSPLTDDNHYDLYMIANDLYTYKLANDYIEQIYVYYENSDTVISAQERMDSAELFTLIRRTDDIQQEDWTEYFTKRFVQSYTPVQYSDQGQVRKSVMYARSIALHNLGQSGDLILFLIPDSMLLGNVIPTMGSSVMILDRDNRVVASSAEQEFPAHLNYEQLAGSSGLLYDSSSDDKLAISYTTSDVTEWKYVIQTPAAVFDQKMVALKRLVFISIALCLIIGSLVAFFFLRRNYHPINRLIRSYVNKAGVHFEGGSNEYSFLQDAINHTFAEKEQISLRLEKHNDVVRSHFLIGLLKGRVESKVPIHESLAAHEINCLSSHFSVLLFHIVDLGKFSNVDGGNEGISQYKLLNFIIMNVVKELSRENNQAYMVEMENSLACIINFKDTDEEGNQQELFRIAEQAREFFKQHLLVNMTVAISGIHKEIFGISYAYQESLEALEYGFVMGIDKTISYVQLKKVDLEKPSERYYYPLNLEQQLINFIKIGDFEKSKELIEVVFNENFEQSSLSLPLAKCLMFDLISTMLKTIEDMSSINQFIVSLQTDSVDILMNCRTVNEMKVQLIQVLRQVCELIERGRKQDNQLVDQIIQYVNEQYSSENLNISMIGEHFELTPSYLSRQFRDQTGEALLSFINKIRLREAKRLLAEQTMTINDISKNVGYGDINTFHRIFKKSEGITPGKYRELL